MLAAIKKKVNSWMHSLLIHHKYYRVEDMVDWGNCGLCGASIKGIFPKWWNWGICDECKTSIANTPTSYMSTSGNDVSEYSDHKRCLKDTEH